MKLAEMMRMQAETRKLELARKFTANRWSGSGFPGQITTDGDLELDEGVLGKADVPAFIDWLREVYDPPKHEAELVR